LQLPEDATLEQLDGTLRRFVVFCSTYHGTDIRHAACDVLILTWHAEQYLQAPAQLEHACGLLLQSELFAFHSERMREILLSDAEVVSRPHISLSAHLLYTAFV
jgi:hypothetical protein